ncbi:reverse transcriptase domain-containing protein [Tanacetum coccineum]
MTLRHDDQSVTFKVGDTKTFSYNIIESVNRVDVIDIACEEYVQEDTVYLEELLSVINSDPNLPPSLVCEINVPEEIRPSCEDLPDLELKDLPSHLEYAFLEGDDKLPVIIAKNIKDEDKTALIKDTFHRLDGCILFDMIEDKPWKSSMDDFSVFGDSLSSGPSTFRQNAPKDFPKSAAYDPPSLKIETPFIFSKECIEAFETLKMKLTQAPILVAPDWDLPFEIMCDASDFAVGAVLGQRLYWPTITKVATTLSPDVTYVNLKTKFRNVMRCQKTLSKFVKSLICGALTLWGRSRLQEGTNIYSWPGDFIQNGVEAK